MIIKDKKKFLRLVVVGVGIMILINVIIFNKAFSHQEVNYKTVSVSNGDTLWSIAKLEKEENSFYEGRDVRDIVQEIKKINNLGTANLKVNQTLEIPTY